MGKKRKVIQVYACPPRENPTHRELYPVLFAVCDDGTVWWKNMGMVPEGKWQLEQDVPQD